MRSRLSGFGFCALAAERLGALRERFLGEPRNDAIGQAQVERDRILVENACLPIEGSQRGQRALRIYLGQHDFDAVRRAESPAPLCHEDTGADFGFQIAGLGEQREIVGNVGVGALADDKRQLRETPISHRIDDGTVIDTMRDGRFAQLPFVVGEGANTHISDYLALLAKAGDLKSKIRAGVFVAERRWTLSTTNGVEIMLPEINPEGALAALASLDREARILDKDAISLDLRLPDRVVARLSEEAFAQRADALGRKTPKSKAGQT